MHRLISSIAASATLAVLLLSGCVGGESRDVPSASPLPSVDAAADAAALARVNQTAEPGERPVLDFTPPISVTGPVARVTEPGTGETIGVSSPVVVGVVTINGADGDEEGNTYDGSPQILMTDEVNMPLALLEVVVGAQVGARILFAAPAAGGGSTLWSFELQSIMELPAQAEGAEVSPEPGLPLVGYADSGTVDANMPMIAPAHGTPPEELVVQPLIVGGGPKVTADSSLVIQVVAALWDGTQVQNTWETGAGIPIVLAGTIRGWREGLFGQTIGSQVMLVVPPEFAWGDRGRGDLIPGNSTLVYVIDILAGV